MNTIKPYTEVIIDNRTRIRTFDETLPYDLYKWHYDEQPRVIQPLNDNDWKFQFDDELPIDLYKDGLIAIPKGLYHRLIKGTTPLTIKIIEY